MDQTNIFDFLVRNSKSSPDKEALTTSSGSSLTHGELIGSVRNLMAGLLSSGLQKHNRVGAIMTEGIDWIVTFLAVSSLAACVPFNPSYSREQLEYYFNLLKLDYMLLEEGVDWPAREAVEDLGIRLLFFSKERKGNTLIYKMKHERLPKDFGENLLSGDDIAFFSFTSGTTSTPKIVPASQNNLYYPTVNVVDNLELTPQDRGLIIPPVFKGVSFNAALWALAGGGSAVIADDLHPDHFFYLLKRFRPTWFRAVPAVHRSFIEYAEKHNIVLKDCALRVVKSDGAFHEDGLSRKMSDLYGANISLSYGSAEGRTLTSDYNAPKGHKKGSVGVSIGPDIGIMNEKGGLLPPGELGEVVLRGPGIFKGYANEDIKVEDTFYGKWFRTGDLGYLDEDGYLFLKGRLKEIINRGGEKISPFELEQVLEAHPAISASVVFSIPDVRGNEEVGCLIVPETQQVLNLKDIRGFLSGKIDHYKMPSKLYLAEKIPMAESGKVSRNSLYRELEANPGQYVELKPAIEENGHCTSSEKGLCEIMSQILNVKSVNKEDDFFNLGGDSLKAATLFVEIQNTFQKQIPLSYIYANGSAHKLAEYLENGGKGVYSFVVPIQEHGPKPPLFFVHNASGEVVAYRHLAQHMSKDRPVFGLRMNVKDVSWTHPITFKSVAKEYLEEVKLIQPQGPYFFSGTCLGGVLACEMAAQLKAQGDEVAFLGMFDPIIVGKNVTLTKFRRTFSEVREVDLSKVLSLIRGKTIRRLRFYKIILSVKIYKYAPSFLRENIAGLIGKEALLRYARGTYKLERYPGEAVYFRPEENTPSTLCSLERWAELVKTMHVIPIKVRHNALFSADNGQYLAARLEEAIDLCAAEKRIV